MKLLSFLNDLGIIPNKGKSYEKNPSLNQGQEYMDFNKMYNREIAPKLNAFQSTGMQGVQTIVESMHGASSAQKNNSKTPQSSGSKLENEFNKTLVEYNSTYKLLMESILNKKRANKDIQKYFGKTVTTEQGDYYYINNNGYSQKYSLEAWDKKNSSCPSDPVKIKSSLLNKIPKGAIMNPGQPCDMAGKNIKDETNNKKAWVDLKGNKYMFNDETWKNKGKSCNISPVSISPDEFSSIKIKGNMTNASFCNELDIDDSILKKIMKLNKRLVVLGEKIAKNLKNVIIKDINNEKTINVEKKKLEKHLSMLKSDNENINNYTDRHNTVIGQNENARLYARSNFLQLLVFFIMAVVITVLSIKAFFIGSSRSMEILAIIMGILMVYFLANYISEKYI